MKRSFLTFVTFALLILVASCAPQPTRRVVILSTNDIHGAIQQFPRLATAIAECRDTVEVILADAGDRWTGNAYVDKAEQRCLPVIEVMNRVGYDVATFGNHEFDYGQELLRERVSQAEFQIICANMESCGSELTVPATTIIERGGIKFGFVGLITNFADGYPDGQKTNFEGLTFPSPFEKAVELQSLKEECDVLVLISHLGDDMDRVLTVDATDYDLIIGGHTHAVLPEGQEYNGTLITQTGKSHCATMCCKTGDGYVRAAYNTALTEPEAVSDVWALYLCSGEEHCDINMAVRHLAPDCRSYSLVKGVAADTAVGSFAGMVYVAQDAQRTDAQQQSRNLLLSDTARIFTQPQLEIYADDVKCTHGATVGQLDDEAIYYMRQRGLSEQQARRLQIEGFAYDVVQHCGCPNMCRHISELTAAKLEKM